jgi:two-component system, cell cycle response regulator DivK
MSKRILIVEDQEDNRAILRDLLTNEATRRIKGDANLGANPIIAVTSYALSGDEAKARTAGCDDYATKPLSPRQLPAKLREYLPGEDG